MQPSLARSLGAGSSAWSDVLAAVVGSTAAARAVDTAAKDDVSGA
jgi:hypothetical protein